MVIDYTQKKDGLDISYVNEHNQISVEELILNDGYYNYVECEEFDPNKLPGLKSFKGSAIKAEPSKFFTHHNINEFFAHDIPNNYKEIHEKISKLAEPNPFSLDIEVLPTNKYGYSPPHEANNPVTSISITDKSLGTLLFITKNPDHPELNHFDFGYIDGILKESLKHHYDEHEFPYTIRVFDTEIEMLNIFVECINNHFHLQIGWNFLQFDWQYIFTRCGKLGVDIKKASPTRKLTKKKIDINANTRVELQIPTHRIVVDYMMLFKESLIYNNLGSYSLDSISEKILKLHKVMYDGNLRKLYKDDYRKFIAYALMDTILVMLIHKATNLLTVEFFQSYYTGVPYIKLSQNSISEALVYHELRPDNMFLLETEKNQATKRKYKGGYVKNPTKKIVEACAGEDYGALYPNSMITMGLSPEAKIDEIKVTELGVPLTTEDDLKWQKYKSMGYGLAPTGRIYDLSIDYLYTRIEKKLLKQRNIFKGHMVDIYLHIIPRLKDKIKSLKHSIESN